MAEPGANILNHRTLYDLKDRLDHSGDTMLRVLEGVNNYFEGVLNVLQQQVEILRAKWEEAQEQLSEAEDALSSCEASQTWDEEDEEYHPSCNSEKRDVERARQYEAECRETYEQGQRIQAEVQSQIEKYRAPAGLTAPPGAEKYLEYLAEDHTNKAIEKLDKIIEIVEQYLRFGVTMDRPGAGQVPVKDSDEQELADSVSLKDKKEAFETGTKKVTERNKSIESSTRVMVCPRCGRPLTLCVCPRLRGKEHTY